MVKQTRLGHIKYWPLWDVDDKLISILAIVGHRVMFLDQYKGQDVSYSLGDIPYRIGISVEAANFFGCLSILRYNGHVDIFHREHL